MSSLLQLSSVTRRFGGLVAVSDVSLSVMPNQIKAIIGPNGAGKTTLFNLITGVLPLSEGTIAFQEGAIHNRKPYAIGKKGISRTFQTAQVFANMTIIENVMLGRHCRSRGGVFGTGFKIPGARREERRIREKAEQWLAFVGVEARLDALPGDVPFVVHRKTEMARALATEPKLLLLDEPAAGLNIRETEEMGELIRRIRHAGITVLIIEHDMSLIMDISDEIFVLNFGEKIAEGTPKEVQGNEAVLEAYLGKEN
ncbi:ATP-binding cassette domain-containing protein [bacterium]|nr:ATP-binding cassette domain-containing protein [bacterium]